jgi:hypothetical protein
VTQRHKVFVSYHHANDEAHKNRFELLFGAIGEILVCKSVQLGDIDPNTNTETVRRTIRDDYLRDSTVTVVLVGTQTWQRKHVDWEIYSSLRDSAANPRSGLIGVLLPTYPAPSPGKFDPGTIPPRLYDNWKSKFAALYHWSDNATEVQRWLHDAFLRRNQDPPPDLSRPMFGKNRSGDRWSD